MITTAFLYTILAFVNWAITQLPPVDPSSSLASSFAAAGGYISPITAVFPLTTFMACLSFVLVFDLGWIIYQVIRWVYQKIPGIS